MAILFLADRNLAPSHSSVKLPMTVVAPFCISQQFAHPAGLKALARKSIGLGMLGDNTINLFTIRRSA
jgi:hypothetical protein